MDPALAFPPSRQCLSTRPQLDAAGVTRHQLARLLEDGDVVRIRRGVYSTGPLAPRAQHLLSGGRTDPAYLAEVRAVLLGCSDGVVAGGRTAAVLWGFDLAVEPDGVELVGPNGSRVPSGVVLRQHHQVAAVERRVAGYDAVRVTSAVQTVVDCALTLPLAQAVVVADSALRTGHVTEDDLVRAAAELKGVKGSRRLRRVLELADAGSESVLESLLRVLLVTRGLTPPVSQQVLRDGTTFLGRVDLCWPDHRLVVECDGRKWHDPADARDADRLRDNRLTAASWRVLRFTWAQVLHDPETVVAQVAACLAGWRAA